MRRQALAIQPDSPIPLYKQLEQILLETLEHMSTGDMFPPERELQEKYHVSRATVRTTLGEIERQGWIKRVQGIGTIVSKPKIRPEIMKLTSFTEDICARGMTPGSRTLDVAIVTPTATVLKALRLQPRTQVLYVRRLRLADNDPVGIHALFIPPALELSLSELHDMPSYYALLRERHRIKPGRALEHLTARNADEEEAGLLEVDIGSALLSIERTTYSDNDVPIEFVKLVYRADRYEYQVALYRE